MNKNVKKTVYKILEKDKLAREDTMYLIQQTIIRMLDVNQGTAFGIVIQGMKYKGISFEAITRAKRKYLEEHPDQVPYLLNLQYLTLFQFFQRFLV